MTEQTRPKVVGFSGKLALLCLLMLPLSVLAVRLGVWQPGLLVFALACLGSLLALIMCLALVLLPRFSTWRPELGINSLIAIPGSLLVVLLGSSSGDLPPIHDITTDTGEPPLFVTAAQVRGDKSNPLTIKPDSIAAQKKAYTELRPISSSLSKEQAFAKAHDTAVQLGWDIYHEDAANGIIEAVETTRIMGFKDDVVIRVRDSATGSRVDLRSVSRVGRGDLGANATRIRGFIEAFNG